MSEIKLVDVTTPGDVVDSLGAVRAEIKHLQDQARFLEDILKNSGESVVDGQRYHAAISHTLRSIVDWKGIAARLNPSRQLVTAHTKQSESVAVRVTAHKKEA